jgi:hypothetical protein
MNISSFLLEIKDSSNFHFDLPLEENGIVIHPTAKFPYSIFISHSWQLEKLFISIEELKR